jgi:hypothetical protein
LFLFDENTSLLSNAYPYLPNGCQFSLAPNNTGFAYIIVKVCTGDITSKIKMISYNNAFREYNCSLSADGYYVILNSYQGQASNHIFIIDYEGVSRTYQYFIQY